MSALALLRWCWAATESQWDAVQVARSSREPSESGNLTSGDLLNGEAECAQEKSLQCKGGKFKDETILHFICFITD